MRNNDDIRALIKSSGLKQWQVAEALGHMDGWFSVKLRHNLTPELRREILAAIVKIQSEVKHG